MKNEKYLKKREISIKSLLEKIWLKKILKKILVQKFQQNRSPFKIKHSPPKVFQQLQNSTVVKKEKTLINNNKTILKTTFSEYVLHWENKHYIIFNPIFIREYNKSNIKSK